jgi:hypothetical protein
MAKKKKLSKKDRELLALMDRVSRVAERKGRALGITGKQYLVGVILRKYPRITPEEAAAESDK